MSDNLDNSLLKARIISWIIFCIPVIFFLILTFQFFMFVNSDEWDMMLIASRGNAQQMVSVIIIGGLSFFSIFIGSFWFFGRYFVERAKNKILRRELDRLNRSVDNTVYPDRLENLES